MVTPNQQLITIGVNMKGGESGLYAKFRHSTIVKMVLNLKKFFNKVKVWVGKYNYK